MFYCCINPQRSLQQTFHSIKTLRLMVPIDKACSIYHASPFEIINEVLIILCQSSQWFNPFFPEQLHFITTSDASFSCQCFTIKCFPYTEIRLYYLRTTLAGISSAECVILEFKDALALKPLYILLTVLLKDSASLRF